MSAKDLHYSNQIVQLYCHGVQLRCCDISDLMERPDNDFRRLAHNPCFDLYEIRHVDESIVPTFEGRHLLVFKESPSAIALSSCAQFLSAATSIGDALSRLVEFMKAVNSPMQLSVHIENEKTLIRLTVCNRREVLSAEPLQFLMVLRLLKIVRLISYLTQQTVPLHAVKIAGKLNPTTKPYVKLCEPEFIYQNQKYNGLVIPTRCLTFSCDANKDNLLGFMQQHADIVLSSLNGIAEINKDEKESKLLAWTQQQLNTPPEQPDEMTSSEPSGKAKQLLDHQTQNDSMPFSKLKKSMDNQKPSGLLLDTSLPLSQVRRRTGVSNLSNLSRYFKETNRFGHSEHRLVRKNRVN